MKIYNKLICFVLCISIIFLIFALSSCDKNSDEKLRAHFSDRISKSYCIDIESYEVYSNGAVKIHLKDGTIIRTSSENVTIVKGHCPYCDVSITYYKDGMQHFYWKDRTLVEDEAN